MHTTSPIAPTATPWRGVVMALAVGVAFASNTSLAALAYRGGATPLAVLLLRACTAFLLLYLLLVARGVPRRLPAPQRRGALMLGCVFAGYSYGVLVAIQYLPVGLVVATFYCFPILVALLEWCSGRQAFSARTAIALLVAFTGILLALNVFGAPLHRLGIALCLAGAVGVTVVMTVSAPLFYSFGIITLFVVLADIGPVKASLLMNIEPVTSVLLGFVLLDQRLGQTQLLGVALVGSAVLLIESANLRRMVSAA